MFFQKRIIFVLTLLVIVIKTGGVSVNAQEQSSIPKGVRTIETVRVDAPPVIDGKLDEESWNKCSPGSMSPVNENEKSKVEWYAEKITGFHEGNIKLKSGEFLVVSNIIKTAELSYRLMVRF